MKCPYCQGEMESGEIRSRYKPYWLPDGRVDPFLVSKKQVEDEGGVPLWERAVYLMYTSYPAWVCRRCGKLVADLDYGDYEG